MEWKKDKTQYLSREALYLGPWVVGYVEYNGLLPKDDMFKYVAECKLPGITGRTGFPTAARAKNDVESSVEHWLNRLPEQRKMKKEITMNFGEAIEALKSGKKMARTGWNGKDMWIILVPGTTDAKLKEGTPYHDALQTNHCEILPHIDMRTVDSNGCHVMQPGWLASSSDMLSDDWVVVS
jgi:hypothetical protein